MKYFTLIAGIPIVLGGMSLILAGGESGPVWALIFGGAIIFGLGQVVVRFQDFPRVESFFCSMWQVIDKRFAYFKPQAPKTLSGPTKKLA